MKKWMTFVPVVALLFAMMVGCNSGEDSKAGGDDGEQAAAQDVKTTDVALTKVCGHCGQAAAEGCCEQGEDCPNCDFKAGSTLCCTGVAQIDKPYCMKCGEIAGAEKCCADGAEVCENCELHKGSPLCCKLKSAEANEKKDN